MPVSPAGIVTASPLAEDVEAGGQVGERQVERISDGAEVADRSLESGRNLGTLIGDGEQGVR